MASRFGRKKRAKMRAEIEARERMLATAVAVGNAAMERAERIEYQHANLTALVEAWDAEICHYLGEFSGLRLEPARFNPGLLTPETMREWRIENATESFLQEPTEISAVVTMHADKLLHVMIDCSEVEKEKYLRIVSMRIDGSAGRLADWVYTIGEGTVGRAKKLGPLEIHRLAGIVAEQFRKRMLKEIGR